MELAPLTIADAGQPVAEGIVAAPGSAAMVMRLVETMATWLVMGT